MSPFSLRVKDEVIASFPEWQTFAKEETYKGSSPYLVITVPPPTAANTELPLRISTWDDEVTVDFDYYHAHFDRWNPQAQDNRHTSALLYVQSLLNEQVAVASWWQSDLCKMASQFDAGSSLQPSLKIAYSRVRVRSWRGSLNVDGVA